MSEPRDLADQLAALRASFDHGFARPVETTRADTRDLLAIRVAEVPYALRLAEVAGVLVDRSVTPMPTAMPALLGIAGVRGSLIPVYDLRLLLGLPGGAPPRWIVLAAAAPVAFGFDRLERHLRLDVAAIARAVDGAERTPHVRELATIGEQSRPILDLASLVEALAQRARTVTSQELHTP